MNFFYIYRNVVFGLIFILNFPVLGISAFWTQNTPGGGSSFGLGIFTSCVSMFVFPVLLLLPIFRKNAFISYIISEIVIISVMWLFWMVSMILVVQNGCISDSGCQSLFAVEGLDIFIFILLLKYLLYLTIASGLNHSRGIFVWTKSIKEFQGTMPGVKLTHSSSDSVDVEGKPTTADASLLGAPQPSAYPPLQHGSYGQPQPTYSAESYSTNPSVQYSKSAPGMQPSTQVNQIVSFSQRPLNSVAQNYTPSMTPAVAQV